MKVSRRSKIPIGFFLGIFLFSVVGFSAASPRLAMAGPANHVVINEVQVDSAPGTGGTDDDWVELFNPTTSDIALNGWSIQKTAGSGGSLNRQALTGTVKAGDYFLIVKTGATSSLIALADIVVGGTFDLANNNTVYLVNDNINISSSTDPNIVDMVGFGTALNFEGIAAAPSLAEVKSLARIPAGEDTDQNSVDFVIQDVPTPQNSTGGDEIGGTVQITITPDAVPVQNITSTGADVMFAVNAAGMAQVAYGLTAAYGSSTAPVAVAENAGVAISLSGLQCNTTYHYSISAQNLAGTESDETNDAVFTTFPCGINLDSLVMTKTTAKANNQYADGWAWEFNITIWNTAETSLKMKFAAWTGLSALNAANNMQFSVNNGVSWVDITANNAYPTVGTDISGIDLNTAAGRQVKIIVRMKVPVGTLAGYYNSSYGILTE